VRHMAEEARVRVRSSRRTGIDEIKKIEKAGEITEDERHDLED
jgi:ribosome recycling factor